LNGCDTKSSEEYGLPIEKPRVAMLECTELDPALLGVSFETRRDVCACAERATTKLEFWNAGLFQRLAELKDASALDVALDADMRDGPGTRHEPSR
jgi:hypothetical protein